MTGQERERSEAGDSARARPEAGTWSAEERPRQARLVRGEHVFAACPPGCPTWRCGGVSDSARIASQVGTRSPEERPCQVHLVRGRDGHVVAARVPGRHRGAGDDARGRATAWGRVPGRTEADDSARTAPQAGTLSPDESSRRVGPDAAGRREDVLAVRLVRRAAVRDGAEKSLTRGAAR